MLLNRIGGEWIQQQSEKEIQHLPREKARAGRHSSDATSRWEMIHIHGSLLLLLLLLLLLFLLLLLLFAAATSAAVTASLVNDSYLLFLLLLLLLLYR